MGASSSTTRILETPLHVQMQPVGAINPRFCLPMSAKLRLKEKFSSWSGDDYVIYDVNSGQKLFRIDGKLFSLSQRKTLLDANGATIAEMREEHFHHRPVYNIFADESSRQRLLQISTISQVMSTEMVAPFQDAFTGRTWQVGLTGNARARAANIWIDKGDGIRIPVARIYRPHTLGPSDEYFVDVAPNVDTAMVVFMCIALDQCQRHR